MHALTHIHTPLPASEAHVLQVEMLATLLAAHPPGRAPRMVDLSEEDIAELEQEQQVADLDTKRRIPKTKRALPSFRSESPAPRAARADTGALQDPADDDSCTRPALTQPDCEPDCGGLMRSGPVSLERPGSHRTYKLPLTLSHREDDSSEAGAGSDRSY